MPNLANLPVADLQAGTGNWSGKGYIDGAKMIWNSAGSLTLSSFSAYVPSLSRCIYSDTDITKTGLVLPPSAFSHLYTFQNGSSVDFEVSSTAPSTPYNGTARTKTGDTSRRYVGSVLTDASGNVVNFRHDSDGAVLYRVGIDTFRVLIGNATTATPVPCSSAVPVTATKAFANIINNDTTHVAWLGNADVVPSSTGYLELIGTGSLGTTLATIIMLDSTQSFQYLMSSGASANLVVRLKGYTYER